MFGRTPIRPVIRVSNTSDINQLSMADLKSYQYPLTIQDWREMGKGPDKASVRIAESNTKLVGFVVWVFDEDQNCEITRLGVIPNARLRGVGTELISEVMRQARREQSDKVYTVVPDIHCQPGDPDDVSEFLMKVGFRATGKVEPEVDRLYGEWRDGYVFERSTL